MTNASVNGGSVAAGVITVTSDPQLSALGNHGGPTPTTARPSRPSARWPVGRNNWLHVGGDGGLMPAAVLLSVAASVRRHGVNPWAYLKHVLAELPGRPAGADPTDLLPGGWARAARASTSAASGAATG